jgi:hypothetical protein
MGKEARILPRGVLQFQSETTPLRSPAPSTPVAPVVAIVIGATSMSPPRANLMIPPARRSHAYPLGGVHVDSSLSSGRAWTVTTPPPRSNPPSAPIDWLTPSACITTVVPSAVKSAYLPCPPATKSLFSCASTCGIVYECIVYSMQPSIVYSM